MFSDVACTVIIDYFTILQKTYFTKHFIFLPRRAKYFRGKKLNGEYEIKVEQVGNSHVIANSAMVLHVGSHVITHCSVITHCLMLLNIVPLLHIVLCY